MRRIILISLVGLCISAGSLLGDLPGRGPRPPRPIPQLATLPPPNTTRIIVVVDESVTKPRLEVPRPVLEKCAPKLAQQQKKMKGSVPALDHLLFALLLAGGGLYLLRGRVRLAFAAAFVVAVGLSLPTERGQVLANMPPPQVSSIPEMKAVKAQLGEVALEEVEIVVRPDWQEVKLTLPPSVAAKLKP